MTCILLGQGGRGQVDCVCPRWEEAGMDLLVFTDSELGSFGSDLHVGVVKCVWCVLSSEKKGSLLYRVAGEVLDDI
jgi:hypothetical protein